MDSNQGWLVFYHKGQIKTFKICRDEAMIKKIIVKAKQFWQEVQTKSEPKKDPERDLYIPAGKEANEQEVESNEGLHNQTLVVLVVHF